MVSSSSSKRRALLPQINIHVPRDRDNNNDDDDRGGRRTPTGTVIPSATPTVRTSGSSLPVQGTTPVSVAASRTTPAGEASTVPLITVTAPAQTTTVTMFVTVSANPVTVTVTATQASAISAAETLAPTTGDRVNTLAPEFDTARTSAAPAVIPTHSAQMGSAMISGPGVALIGGLGVAGMASLRILPLGRKEDAADLHS